MDSRENLRNIAIILALACVILLRQFMRGMSWKQFVGVTISSICVLVIVLLVKPSGLLGKMKAEKV